MPLFCLRIGLPHIGQTQKDLAKYLQCSQVSYSHYELGKRDIPTDVLIKLAAFYHTSTDYLLGLTDVRKPYPNMK